MHAWITPLFIWVLSTCHQVLLQNTAIAIVRKNKHTNLFRWEAWSSHHLAWRIIRKWSLKGRKRSTQHRTINPHNEPRVQPAHLHPPRCESRSCPRWWWRTPSRWRSCCWPAQTLRQEAQKQSTPLKHAPKRQNCLSHSREKKIKTEWTYNMVYKIFIL